MRCLTVLALLCVTASAVEGQARRTVKPSVIKRAQDADVIEAAGGNLAIALNVKWDGGSQEIIDLKGCVATVKTTRQMLTGLTIDEQTFDASDLVGGDFEASDGSAAYEFKFYSAPKLRPFVTRKRTMYIDGAPRVIPAENVVYLSIWVPSSESADVAKPVIAAMRSYRDFCERK